MEQLDAQLILWLCERGGRCCQKAHLLYGDGAHYEIDHFEYPSCIFTYLQV